MLFQNILFLRSFLVCNGRFGLFSKIKKGSGASFWSIFIEWFFHKSVSYLILYEWTKFQCHTLFVSQDIKQVVLLSSYLVDGVINFKIFLGSISKAMVDREKRGEDENTKIWISRERKKLFRWNKFFFFIVLEGLSFGEK